MGRLKKNSFSDANTRSLGEWSLLKLHHGELRYANDSHRFGMRRVILCRSPYIKPFLEVSSPRSASLALTVIFIWDCVNLTNVFKDSCVCRCSMYLTGYKEGRGCIENRSKKAMIFVFLCTYDTQMCFFGYVKEQFSFYFAFFVSLDPPLSVAFFFCPYFCILWSILLQ